jgi:hypothetical protein
MIICVLSSLQAAQPDYHYFSRQSAAFIEARMSSSNPDDQKRVEHHQQSGSIR